MAFSSSDRCLHKGVVARHFTSNPVFPFFPTTRENYPSACLAYIWSITLSPPRIIIYSRLRNHSYDRHPFRRSNRHYYLQLSDYRIQQFFFREKNRGRTFPFPPCTSIFQNIVHFETTRTRACMPQSQPGIPLTCIFFRTASPVRFPRERHDVESDQPAFLEPADTAAIERGEAYSSAP